MGISSEAKVLQYFNEVSQKSKDILIQERS